MYKVLQNFGVPGMPLFEAGQEYDTIPEVETMIARGLVVRTEKMIEKVDIIVGNENKKTKK